MNIESISPLSLGDFSATFSQEKPDLIEKQLADIYERAISDETPFAQPLDSVEILVEAEFDPECVEILDEAGGSIETKEREEDFTSEDIVVQLSMDIN